MTSSLPEWRAKLADRWQAWRANPRATLDALGANSLYYAMAGTALYPIAAAVAQGDLSAIGLLYQLGAGVGVNLIANAVQQWADESDAAQGLAAAAPDHPELPKALDAILDNLEALAEVRVGLSAEDRAWFEQTFRQDAARAGSRLTIQIGPVTNTGVYAAFGSAAVSEGVAVVGNVSGGIHVHPPGDQLPVADLRAAYLSDLIAQARAVPLAGVDPRSVSEDTRRDLDLAAVYTALMTQSLGHDPDHVRHDDGVDTVLGPSRRLSAIEVLNAETRLALLGDPGSGKSTFVNYVVLCLAGEALGQADANLAKLRRPLPGGEDRRRRRPDEQPMPQPWDHGPLLPVRVILRDFVARGLPPAGQPARISGDTLWAFITQELPEPLRDYAGSLRDELLQAGGLLLLDGLDEVPEADHRREQVKTAVQGLAAMFPRLRILVTSRTYAYQRQDWKLKDFAEAVLAPFEPAQIEEFVERWYRYVGEARRLASGDAEGRAAVLKAAIARNSRLFELATRPLLLTLMASLHAWRGGSLPERREELYDQAVELLLDQWESQKVRRRPDGSIDVLQPGLAEWLRVDQKAIRQLLNRLAYEAHRDQPSLTGTADIAQDRLVAELIKLSADPDARPARLVEYLRDQAGVLEPRGVGVFAFPHRTFQEYLAACHLTDFGFPDDLAELLLADPNRWREVVLLAGAKAARGTASAAWTLAEALCHAEAPAPPAWNELGSWGALLAAQVLLENNSLEQVAPRNQPKMERIRNWLAAVVTQGALPPVDRAQAGEALAALGDPRFRPDAWYLPAEPLLGFVEIPAGPFTMGSDRATDPDAYDDEQPEHQVDLPAFYIARYPVTVAQFRAFAEMSGHQPSDPDSFLGMANYPVDRVTWHEALAYCEWLNETLRSWPSTPAHLARLLQREGWRVTLPSEAEWEKAARGTDARRYPWGDDFDSARANMDETGIGSRTAVGSFPSGASPYGIQDLGGNVLEWTRSLWGGEFVYPYTPAPEREVLNAGNDGGRVMRGGAFYVGRQFVRCAHRVGAAPGDGVDLIGFRVVVSPFRP